MDVIRPFDKPTYTQVSNQAIEYIMPSVQPSTWVVICATLRQTVGYHRLETKTTIAEYEELTGLGRTTIIKSLKEAVSLNILIKSKKGRSNAYQLNTEMELSIEPHSVPIDSETGTDSVPIEGANGTDSVPIEGDIKESKDLKKPLNKANSTKQKFNLPVKVAEDLELHFCQVSGIVPPDWNDKPAGVYKLWRDPFKRMLYQVLVLRLMEAGRKPDPTKTSINPEDIELVKELNRKIIAKMQRDRLTIASPKSLLNVFTSELAYHNNGRGAGETSRSKREEEIAKSLEKYQ